MKLTPWYPGHIKPVRHGCYQTRHKGKRQVWYRYWNGIWWGVGMQPLTHVVVENGAIRSPFQDQQWRGVAK